jgi:lipoprotein NlpI
MTVGETARRKPPIGAVLVLILAALLYAGMMAALDDLRRPGNDAMGRGLDAGFGLLFGIGVWLLLGVLLLIGWIRGAMPDWSVMVAGVLWPASAVSAVIAFDFIDHHDGSYLIVPALLPPLIAGYAMWARLTSLHRLLPPLPTSVAAWVAIALVAAAPLPRFVIERHERHVIAAQEAAEAERQAAIEAEKQRLNLGRFEKLTADSPLWDYAAFFGKDNALSDRAIAAARALTHLQADAEEALRRDMGFPLVEYSRLDLSPTPAFCTEAGAFLSRDEAKRHAPDAEVEFDDATQPFTDPDDLSVIEWLTGHCDIDEAVRQIRDAVGSYKQTGSRDAYLAVLAWRRGNGFWVKDDKTRALAEYDEALRLSPDNDQFHKMRGNLYAAMGRLDDAIADFNDAVRLNPGYSDAFFSRGYAYSEKRDDDNAIASFNEAIRINPSFSGALNNRGFAYIRQGKLDLALADFDAAIQAKPDLRVARLNRARVHFYRAEYGDAAVDAAAALAAKADDPYTVLLLYLARLHAGQDAASGLRADAAALDTSTWPYPIVAALLHQQDAQNVLADAGKDANPDRRDNLCDANFYFGDETFAGGDAASARPLLQSAVANCSADAIEATLAKYELARLP